MGSQESQTGPANLSGAGIIGTDLSKSDLSESVLVRAHMSKVKLIMAP